jgi:predicted transcriptional regulator
MGTSSASVRTEEQAILDTEALRLRSSGMTYQKIADQLGVTKQTAYNRVQRALAAIPYEAVEEYRRIEGGRLDAMLEVALNSVLVDGKVHNIERVIMIMDRRAKMLGLDSPVKMELLTLDMVTSEIRRLEAALGDSARDETERTEATSGVAD